MKHTEIPQNFDGNQLEGCDQLVFAQIKRFMNSDTRTCYPKLETIHDLTGLSQQFLKDAIKRLSSFGLIQITRRKGTSNLYYFPPETDQFEMFSEDFLDLKLPIRVKEYYMKLQQHLFNKEEKISYTQYSDNEIAKLVGLSLPTVKKYNLILQESGYLNTEITTYKDEAGFNIRQLNFDMEKLGQFGLGVKAVTQQVSENTEDIATLKSKIDEYEKRIKSLERLYHISDVKEVDFYPESYNM